MLLLTFIKFHDNFSLIGGNNVTQKDLGYDSHSRFLGSLLGFQAYKRSNFNAQYNIVKYLVWYSAIK